MRSRLKLWQDIIVVYFRDIKNYLKYSATSREVLSREYLDAKIMTRAHQIEKGLSLRETCPGFGSDVISALKRHLKQYYDLGYPVDSAPFRSGIAVLIQYTQFNKDIGLDLDALNAIDELIQEADISMKGTYQVTRSEINNAAKGDFDSLSRSRHSIRNFCDKPVDLVLIERSVRIAQRAPSACNRQPVRVYVVEDKQLQQRLLAMQNGNRGFREQISKLLVITVENQAYSGIEQRHLPYVDSGIFVMALLYSLHYLGLGACALNWCVDAAKDDEIRMLLDLPNSESVILLIAVGHMSESMQVAKSRRKALDRVLRVLR